VATGQRVADRYQLRARLGQGGHGEVWEADDPLSGEVVAVKLLHGGFGAEPHRVRREVAVLRLLHLPGVVRLLDEGVHDGCPFLVMERVHGAPFPGGDRAPPCAWEAIAEATVAVLETLARIHAAGVIHRDLKPENILVDAEGRTTLLDFGLSIGDLLGEDSSEQGRIVGTPAYLAPEQIRGDPVTPRADLYALGVLLYEALSGELPHPCSSLHELIAARLNDPPAPLGALAPLVPPAVAALVERLLSVEVEDRPASAAEVLGVLRGQPLERLAFAALPAVADEETLRALFTRRSRFLHLQTDAARALFTRTAGEQARVSDEVNAWVRIGLGRRDGAALAVDREALDRLEAGLALDQRLLQLLAGSGDGPILAPQASVIAREACALARRQASLGRLGQAVSTLREGVLALRRRPGALDAAGAAEELSLLSLWVEIALAERTSGALDRVLYELSRAPARSEEAAHLEALARAALALTAGAERALALVEALPPFDAVALERTRQGLRVLVARRASSEHLAIVLAEVTRWAAAIDDPATRAAVDGWLGRLRYQEGRFEESAELHRRAAEGEPWIIARIMAMNYGAGALIEAFHHEEAAALAEEAQRLAAGCRHVHEEVTAAWLRRMALYRAGRALRPDPSFVNDVAEVSLPEMEALVSLTEAAVLLRDDQLDAAAALAERACQIWTRMGKQWGALLARCLAIRCGRSPSLDEAKALAEKATRCPIAGLGLQMLGLVGPAFPALRPLFRGATGPLSDSVPRSRWHLRMDVLSVNEARLGMGAGER
jgi:Protein kinase domain